jgi:glycosidase
VAGHRLHLAAALLPLAARDGGYDISDFNSVHPDYGTIEDARAFIEAAHSAASA